MNEEIVALLNKQKLHLQSLLKNIKIINKLINDPTDNLSKIKQYQKKIKEIFPQIHLSEDYKRRIMDFLNSLDKEIRFWEEKRKNKFGLKLEEKLSELNLKLEGHYPLLKASLYTMEVVFKKEEVVIWYGPQQEKLGKVRLNTEEVFKTIKKYHTEITNRKFDPNVFLKNLYTAYEYSLFRQNKGNGVQVPISDILIEYTFLIQDRKFKLNPKKENYKNYTRAYFSYDLFLLPQKKLGNKELILVTATRAYTRRASDFLWIPLDLKGNGVYISHIKFREV